MSVDTRAFLSLHASAERVHQVLARLLGVPFTLHDPSGHRDDGDPLGVPSVRFERERLSVEVANNGRDPSYCRLTVGDHEGEEWTWGFHLEDADQEESKTLSGSSTPLNAAVAVAMVRFFGGQVCYLDTTNRIALEVPVDQALFPPKAPGQGCNARYDQFQAALLALPPLEPQDLLDRAPDVEFSPESTWALHGGLMAYLGALAAEQRLGGALPDAPARRPGPRL